MKADFTTSKDSQSTQTCRAKGNSKWYRLLLQRYVQEYLGRQQVFVIQTFTVVAKVFQAALEFINAHLPISKQDH